LEADVDLDGAFRAVADPTRRAILQRLAHGAATTGQLAAPNYLVASSDHAPGIDIGLMPSMDGAPRAVPVIRVASLDDARRRVVELHFATMRRRLDDGVLLLGGPYWTTGAAAWSSHPLPPWRPPSPPPTRIPPSRPACSPAWCAPGTPPCGRPPSTPRWAEVGRDQPVRGIHGALQDPLIWPLSWAFAWRVTSVPAILST
jgi:DNA-binding transcriptional ArsR family regulator